MPSAPSTPKPAVKATDTIPPKPPKPADKSDQKPIEIGGPTGPEPTRYGDWERNGRCTDF
ncbi:MAG TPA: DUF1674 domain-containing protein [Stellaceae bacterium]|nr:DUF1674 domain-containing protein [Stellaceae bacterium]